MSSWNKERQKQRAADRPHGQAQQAEHSHRHGLLRSSPIDPDLGAATLHAADLYESLLARGLADDDARDVVQEVLTRAIQYRDTFRSARALKQWAFVVARNLAYDRRQEERRLVLGDPPPPELPDPADVVAERLFADDVLRAGARLSERDRQAIAAAVWKLRPKDVTEQRRFNLILHRARARLRKRIDGALVGAYVRARWWTDAPTHSAVSIAASTALVGAVTILAGGPSTSVVVLETAPSTASIAPPKPEAVAMPTMLAGTASESVEIVVHDRTERTVEPRASPPPTVMSAPRPQSHAIQPVRVATPDRRFVEVGTKKNHPGASLVCLRNIPRLGTTCVDLPEN